MNRPSMLPKLACCRCYVPSSEPAGEAAKRGTLLDALIRAGCRDGVTLNSLPEEDRRAVLWAFQQLDDLSKGCHVYLDEEELHTVALPGIQAGTMDACCPEAGWLADFKTGQIRDYKAQMAAYALSCMREYFCDEWTAYVLFIDQRWVTTYYFTREGATQYLRSILERPMQPTPCEYCTWCGAFRSCPAVEQAATECTALELPKPKKGDDLPEQFSLLLNDHEKAADFLAKLDIVQAWADKLKDGIKAQLNAGVESTAFKLQARAGRRKASLQELANVLPVEVLLEAAPLIPIKTAEELCKQHGTTLPAAAVFSTGGSTALTRTKKK